MSEDDLIAVDHKLAELQRRRTRYVKRLAELDPNRNADAFDVVLKRIDELNTALIRVSSLQAR